MTAIAHHPHRVTRAVAGVRSELASVAEVPLWSMDAKETAATIDGPAGGEGAAGRARGPAAGPRRSGRRSWADRRDVHGELAGPPHEARRPAAHRTVDLAHGLDAHDQTREAWPKARSSPSRRRSSSAPSTTCPTTSTQRCVEEAEAHLIAEAEHFDPVQPEADRPPAARGHRPRRRRRPRSRAAGEGRARRPGRHAADDVGGRARQGPRHVHPRRADRRDVQEGAPGAGRPEAPRRQRPARGAEADPGADGRGARRAHPALPHPQAPQGRRHERHRRGDDDPRLTPRRAQGRADRHRPHHLAPRSPASSPARPGSSPPSSAGSPRSSTSAGRSGSTPNPSASPRPSNPKAAPPRAATPRPGSVTSTTPSPGAKAAAPTATPS